eukprot:419552-Pleurochrysis_carterae.AAC.2
MCQIALLRQARSQAAVLATGRRAHSSVQDCDDGEPRHTREHLRFCGAQKERERRGERNATVATAAVFANTAAAAAAVGVSASEHVEQRLRREAHAAHFERHVRVDSRKQRCQTAQRANLKAEQSVS